MVEQDKPFKTIEVVDSRTSQLCKVACMSCIRGHRTTSCGIPVCRSKIFWTVKRPGRPSNSCTCRYGASGRCKCVVVKPACPHKSKKGEKRSGECRCDEQGRYCCLIEPEHWNSLLALQNPAVEFFPSREALEARQTNNNPATPAYSITSTNHYGPTSPVTNGHHVPRATQPMTPAYSIMHSSPPSTTLTPRFGMMGVGGPQGSAENNHDPLAWQGDVPHTPHQFYPPPQYQQPQPEESSCCQSSAPTPQAAPQSYLAHTIPQQDPRSPGYAQFNPPLSRMSISTEPPPSSIPATFHYDKINVDYLNYQFPNAICQNCGLNGCTCKSCPPVMQSFSTGSWAQCCGRKHARPLAPAPAPAPAPIPETTFSGAPLFGTYPRYNEHDDPTSNGETTLPISTNGFDTFGEGETNDMQMSDFIMSELDRPSSGGCCGGKT